MRCCDCDCDPDRKLQEDYDELLLAATRLATALRKQPDGSYILPVEFDMELRDMNKLLEGPRR